MIKHHTSPNPTARHAADVAADAARRARRAGATIDACQRIYNDTYAVALRG